MSEALKILPHYTYSDYLHWEGKWEVIAGIPYAMSPAPIPKQQQIASNLSFAFSLSLKKQCRNCKVYQPIDYILSDDTILQPDLLIVCKEITKKFLNFPPALIVEILSPATALKDRHTKFALYEKQKIQYYLIVDPEVNEVEIYALNQEEYELKQKGNSFSFSFQFDDCPASVDFSEIW